MIVVVVVRTISSEDEGGLLNIVSILVIHWLANGLPVALNGMMSLGR